ncbi:MAG: preprotein translocase subunit SecG [bacterium]|nr:preprotein translocase subunit SecG [bacterium]
MIINIIQIVLAVLLIITVLLQRQGSGLSGAFGGEGEFHHTKRGPEKYLFVATIILSILFFGTALANIVL